MGENCITYWAACIGLLFWLCPPLAAGDPAASATLLGRVTDARTGQPVPCIVAITDAQGRLVAETELTAWR